MPCSIRKIDRVRTNFLRSEIDNPEAGIGAFLGWVVRLPLVRRDISRRASGKRRHPASGISRARSDSAVTPPYSLPFAGSSTVTACGDLRNRKRRIGDSCGSHGDRPPAISRAKRRRCDCPLPHRIGGSSTTPPIGDMNAEDFMRCNSVLAFLLFCGAANTAIAQSTSSAPSKPFVHPGLLHTRADLDRMRQEVDGGREPWKTRL